MAGLLIKAIPPSQSQLLTGILDAFAVRLEAAMRNRLGHLRAAVAAVVERAIPACPEAESLISGKLRHELGVVDASPAILAVARNVAGGLRVTPLGVRRQGTRITGGLLVEILKSDLSEVLEVPGGEFTSEGGYHIPWMRWLTAEGDRVLVLEHRFEAGHAERSRTGDGIMVRGGTWQVPAEFSGVETDNWVSRAVLGAAPLLQQVVAGELIRGL